MIVDGILLALLGRSYAQLRRLGTENGTYYKITTEFATLSLWLLQLLGLPKPAAGVKVLGRAPLTVSAVDNSLAGVYSAVDTSWRDWLYADAHRDFDRMVATCLPSAGEILDLGVGIGANLGRLLQMDVPFASYTGVDRTEAMLEQARAKYSHLRAAVVEKAWWQLPRGGHIVLLFEVEDEGWYSRLENRALDFSPRSRCRSRSWRSFRASSALTATAALLDSWRWLCWKSRQTPG